MDRCLLGMIIASPRALPLSLQGYLLNTSLVTCPTVLYSVPTFGILSGNFPATNVSTTIWLTIVTSQMIQRIWWIFSVILASASGYLWADTRLQLELREMLLQKYQEHAIDQAEMPYLTFLLRADSYANYETEYFSENLRAIISGTENRLNDNPWNWREY